MRKIFSAMGKGSINQFNRERIRRVLHELHSESVRNQTSTNQVFNFDVAMLAEPFKRYDLRRIVH
jgi:hypothetical protein